MAAPGIGIGDLVNACAFIYDICVKYKDAPKEFDEIADKAKSTAVVLERIRTEAKLRGNLVDRAGPQGYSQLEHHLKGLKTDSDKLKTLVAKYARIHDEGPGRRMLFTVMESSGLTDLRRRIGLHEQMLEMWYMTLIYGSLRRIEGGQEDILKAIEAIKKMSPTKRQHVRRRVHEGDSKPLEHELHKSGLDPVSIKSALGAAVEYVDAPPREQVKMESRAKSSTVRRPKGGSFGFDEPRFSFNHTFEDTSHFPFPEEMSEIHRRKSTGSRRPRHFSTLSIHDGSSDDELFKEEILIKKEKDQKRKESSRRRGGDTHGTTLRPRSSSHNDPDPILLAVPSRHHHQRSASQHTPHLERREGLLIPSIYASDGEHPPPQSPRHRSKSRSLHPESEPLSQIDPVQPERRRRDSSTHSYTRERERERSGRRSTSRGRHESDEVADRRRVVTKMDRIDSIPIQ